MPDRTRSYRSARREQSAAQTRQDILETARDLFITHGYAQVTMGQIARSAGVATKTLYASVGTKTQLLHALLAVDVADSKTTGLHDEVLRSKDLASAMTCLAHGIRGNTERFAASIDLLHSSMTSDDKARQVWEYVVAQYRQALREIAQDLVALGVVAPHLDVDGAADRLWLCFGLSAWRSLVVDCGWSYDDAERLLARQAVSVLEDPGPA
ncbi:TetR/AcrR family transcriptional regulator [Streptomyces rubiginosohelvolus]|uniref:TetR/AcrR family transcriptional regulator n=1 Tax=Streptomyces rubiginosohelvolus TaxID=67362 RepID=UPI00379642EC